MLSEYSVMLENQHDSHFQIHKLEEQEIKSHNESSIEVYTDVNGLISPIPQLKIHSLFV